MLVCAVLVVSLLCAHPPAAQTAHRLLVEAPARWLSTVTRGKAVFYCALALAGLGLSWLFGADGVRLFMFMAPDLLVWFAVFDVSVFIDALVLGAILAQTARVRRVVPSIIHRAGRTWSSVIRRIAAREPGTRGGKIRRGPSADEPDPARFGFAKG